MEPQRWAAIESLYHAALEKEASERSSYLHAACRNDAELRAEVESLLAFSEAEMSNSPPHPEVRKLWDSISDEPTASTQHQFDDAFPATARFTCLERLGSGTFGVVYRAFDRERNIVVALKKLLHNDSANLMRFKREFRSLVDVMHPNLVQLYELFGDDRQWFFTMELVEGTDFLARVRPPLGRVDWQRLRNAMLQLAAGVKALHASGRLHRDLKPSNVLITAEGRVVVLDFGMVKLLESPAQAVEQSVALAGSPAYMAPEQAAGGAINEAVDWYAVGVILFKSITGQLPFAGSAKEALERKQQEGAARSSVLNADVPADLDEACWHLLERDPAKRLQGAEMLLAAEKQNTAAGRTEERFVGRRAELDLLRRKFVALSSGTCQVVLLEGQSGIGKTSLITHFLDGLNRDDPGTVILPGRCRESESVPYKALDPIADELVRHLQSMPEQAAVALLPRHPELLRRLFPIFGELPILGKYPDRPLPELDEQQIRRRAFEAFRELLGRMANRGRVAIWIDDLQWSDLDSIAFIAELIVPANAPGLLLLLSFRAEEAESSKAVRALRGLQKRLPDGSAWLEMQIKGLSPNEGRELLDLLQPNNTAMSEEQSNGILRESGGSPLLLSELLRFVAGGSTRTEEVLVTDMIRHRSSTLSVTARELLEALSVAGEPLTKAALYRTVKVMDEDPARAIGLLVQEHLVRVTADAEGGKLEPFHDQVREASLAWLSDEELRNWHAHLAEVFESEGSADPQRLLRHYQGAGNKPAAFKAALSAAKNAENALAFEQAARFYGEALETGEADAVAQASLQRGRAEALVKAGRGHEAAQCYLAAAALPGQNADDMLQLAATQFMRSGYLDEGTKLFANLLRSAGLHVPSSRRESLLRMLMLRAFMRLRGLGWRERTEATIPADTLRKLDLLWSGATALIACDTVFGSYLQAKHMLAALRAGEPSRLVLSFGFAAFYECLGGEREYHHARKLIHTAQQLANRVNDPYLSVMIYGSWGGVDLLCAKLEDGLAHCRMVIDSFEKGNRRARAWELGTMHMLLTWFLGWGGKIRELAENLPSILDEARSRGDVYGEVAARCCVTSHLVELAADDPERAMAETSRTLKQWRKSFYDLPHFYATLTQIECHLYAGRTEEARRVMLADWQTIRRSLFTRKAQPHKAILAYARGRTALAEWLRQRDANDLRLETEHFAARLKKLGSPWGDAFSLFLRAGVMAGLDRKAEAAALLAQAEQVLRRHSVRLFAAAALRRRGELGGVAGIQQVEEADAFMRAENIVKPDRMTAMILPGNWN